jgi:hypothetical protein
VKDVHWLRRDELHDSCVGLWSPKLRQHVSIE